MIIPYGMEENFERNRRIARNSVFMSVRMVIVIIISLYTTRAVLNVLGVEDYGIYNVVCGFVSMFGFLNTSMSNGIQRFYNFEYGMNGTEGANRVFVTSIVIQMILSFSVIILTESIGIWYIHNKMVIPVDRMYAAEWIFQISILSFIIVIMQVPLAAAVMAHEKMDFYAFVSITDAILKLLFVLVIPFVKFDKLVVYGLALLLIVVIEFVLYYIYCKIKFEEIYIPKNKHVFDSGLFRSMLGFSGWNLFGSFSNIMRDQGINLILNFFFGPIVNAARGVAMQVNSGVSSLVYSILTPVRPQVIQSYARGEMDRVMHLTYTISKFSLYFLLIISLPLCLEIGSILKLWIGQNVPNHASAFIILILLTNAILIPMSSQAALVHASGEMRNYQVIGGVVKFLSVPIAFVLLKMGYAPEWALIMVFLFDAIGLVVGMFIIRSIMPFNIKEYTYKVFVPLIPVAISSFIAGWLLHHFIKNELLRVFLVFTICTIVCVLAVYLIGMNKEEKELIKRLIVSKLSKKK